MVDPEEFDAVPDEQPIEIAASAGDGDDMAEPALLAGQIDGGVDMAVRLRRVIQQVQNTHGPIMMLGPPTRLRSRLYAAGRNLSCIYRAGIEAASRRAASASIVETRAVGW